MGGNRFFRHAAIVGVALLLLCAWSVPGALAQTLNPKKIKQFVDPLPRINTFADPSFTSGVNTQIDLRMEQFRAPVLSTGTLGAGVVTQTLTWGYRNYVGGTPDPITSYLGPVIATVRGTPTEIKFTNNLPYPGSAFPGDGAYNAAFFYWGAVDQTLHWADPNDLKCAEQVVANTPPAGPCATPYDGQTYGVPAVPHLHGGEIPPVLDGGPDAWFTSAGNVLGHAYYSKDGTPGGAFSRNYAIYRYPNVQEASPIWFHDHGLGITRLNVYAGIAGAYPIIENGSNGYPGGQVGGIGSGFLNDPLSYIPVVLQDRTFTPTGELFFDALGLNPEHPFWVPEFVGNTIVINGKTWPKLDLAPGLYRFLFLNGSNARAYVITPKVFAKGKVAAPAMYAIATDGGYLDAPALIPNVTIMPGERYDVIMDLRNIPVGGRVELQNTARTPFPGGAPVTGNTTGKIMSIKVVNTAVTPATPWVTTVNYDPTVLGAMIRQGTYTAPVANWLPQIARLVNNAAPGTVAAGVTINKTRQLTLNEVMGPGGPLEVLVNNTKYSGTLGGANVRSDFLPVSLDKVYSSGTAVTETTYYSELPSEGQTELWEIVNLTADAHPIHLHLVDFQVMNRQNFNVAGYQAAYDALFPGALFIGGFGPPLTYGDPTVPGAPGPDPLAAGKLGGNPDVFPFLVGTATPALNYEQGWKDTVIMYPGQVTRIMVRWAPNPFPATTSPASATYSFNPNGDHGFVWHCHIIDHEDNEMMRPNQVQANDAAVRTYVQGVDY